MLLIVGLMLLIVGICFKFWKFWKFQWVAVDTGGYEWVRVGTGGYRWILEGIAGYQWPLVEFKFTNLDCYKLRLVQT